MSEKEKIVSTSTNDVITDINTPFSENYFENENKSIIHKIMCDDGNDSDGNEREEFLYSSEGNSEGIYDDDSKEKEKNN